MSTHDPYATIRTLTEQVEHLLKVKAAAIDYIVLLENCADGYYRVQETEERAAWSALVPDEEVYDG